MKYKMCLGLKKLEKIQTLMLISVSLNTLNSCSTFTGSSEG